MQFDFLWTRPGRVHDRRAVAAQTCFFGTTVALAWSTYLHYYLWRELGYRHIPAISTLFLVHTILGTLLVVLVTFVHRVWTALAAAVFALVTLASFLVATNHGLFGFRESWAAPDARSAALSELLVAFLALAGARLTLTVPRPRSRSDSTSPPRGSREVMRGH